MDIVEVKEGIREKLEDRCEELEHKKNKLTKHASGQATLQGEKHLIWEMIIVEETKVQSYLYFIQDKESTIQAAKKHIQKAKMDLHKRPLDTIEGAISFLNSLIDEDIRRGNIWDWIPFITWARRVVHKHRHLNMVKAK